ncbi:MAG: translation elongation factor Ts [Candidatus Sumerlaeaceae bacterium]
MAEITAQMVKELREKSGAGMMDCKKALTESAGDFQKAMNLLRERGEAIQLKRSGRVAKEGLIVAKVAADGRSGALIELNSESDFVARNDDFKALADRLAAHALNSGADGDLNETQLDGQQVSELLKSSVGKIGENIKLSRSAKLETTDGVIVSYIHPPGKIGVLVEIATGNGSHANDAQFQQFARSIAMHVAATSPLCVSRTEVPSAALDNEKEVYRKQALNEGKPEKIVDKIVEGRVAKYYGEVCLLEQAYVQDPDQKVEQYVKQAGGKFGGEVGVKRFVRYQLGEGAKAEGGEE